MRQFPHASPWRRSLAALPILLLMALPALAQGGVADVQLVGEESFTIQAATKTEIPVSKAPGSVTVITARQIRESGARTIPEILRLVAGVNVRWNPMVQNLDVRGFGQTPFTSRVLLLIDGIPYNAWDKGGFPQHPSFDFYMLQNVKKLEIVRGPGSALYGENAYWGVINIVTLSGEDLQGGRVEIFGGDLENRSVGAVFGSKLGQDGSIFVSARAMRGQLPMRFWYEDSDASSEGTDFFVKTTFKKLEFSYYRHEDEFDGFVDNIEGLGVFESADKVGQTVNIAALKASHEIRPGITIDGKISFANRYGSHCATCHSYPQDPEEFEGQSDHGSQLLGEVSMAFRNIPGHDILVGVEARRVEAGDHVEELVGPHEHDEVVVEYSKAAAYIQDQISLAGDKLRLTLGARYDGSTDRFDEELSPRAALVYAPNDKWAFRAGWSTAFRFPNFSEQYSDTWFINVRAPFGTFPLASFGPNFDLKPEQIRTFEVGAEVKIDERWSAKLDLYQSEVEDFIVLAVVEQPAPATALVISENHPDKATIEGLELELRYNASRRLTAFINFAHQTHEQDGNRRDSSGRLMEFVYAPENKINIGAYWGPFRGFSGSVEAMWKDESSGPSFYNFASGGQVLGTLDAYTKANVRLSYDLPWKLGNTDDALRFSIYGKNLLDEEITETYLTLDMTQPGRTYYGAIELRY